MALKLNLKYPNRIPRPLARHLGISITTCVLFFIAFLLYLLVALSLPIIKSIYLFDVNFTQEDGDIASAVATDLRFGVWGLCASSVLEGFSQCIGPQLGYTVPESILEIIGYEDLIDDVIEALSILLVLHPVCAGLAFIVMFTSLFLEDHAMTITSLVIAVLTIILGTLVFAVDIAIVIVGKIKFSALEAFEYTVSWGPAVWMILVAVICLYVGMILLSVVVCQCCGVGKEFNVEDEEDEVERY